MEDEIYEIIAKVVAGETLTDEERQDLRFGGRNTRGSISCWSGWKEPVRFIGNEGE